MPLCVRCAAQVSQLARHCLQGLPSLGLRELHPLLEACVVLDYRLGRGQLERVLRRCTRGERGQGQGRGGDGAVGGAGPASCVGATNTGDVHGEILNTCRCHVYWQARRET